MCFRWDQNIRRILYCELVEEFGPKRNWKNLNNTENKEEYKNFLKKFAKKACKLTTNEKPPSPGAIKNQIAWGSSMSQKSIKHYGHTYNFILNRAAALEMGFIKSNELPSIALFDYKD